MSLRKPLPFMRFYCDDYLADTPHLSTQEHGAYMLIIMNYWRRQKAIPESRVASIALLSTIEFQTMRDTLAEFFEVQNGIWIHKRIEAELKESILKSKRISDGQKSRTRHPSYLRTGRLRGAKWRALRLKVFLRDKCICQYCFKYCEKPQCDHYYPICLGGSNEIENLKTACPSCNKRKSGKSPEQWRASL